MSTQFKIVGSYAKLRAQVIVKWRGKPVFIRHRTPDEIKDAENTKWEGLRDPQPDSDRVQRPEWLIMLGMSQYPSVLCGHNRVELAID